MHHVQIDFSNVKSSCNAWSLVSYSHVHIHSRLWPWTTSPLWQRPVLPLSSCKRYSLIWSLSPSLPPCQSPLPHTPHGRAKLQEEQNTQWQKQTQLLDFIKHSIKSYWCPLFCLELTGITASKSPLFFLHAFPFVLELCMLAFLVQGRAFTCKFYFHSWKLIVH